MTNTILRHKLSKLEDALDALEQDASGEDLAAFMDGLTDAQREQIAYAALGINKQTTLEDFLQRVQHDSGFRYALEIVARDRPADVLEVGFILLGGRAAVSSLTPHVGFDLTEPYSWTTHPDGYKVARTLTPDEVDAAIPQIVAQFKHRHAYDYRRELAACGSDQEREQANRRWFGRNGEFLEQKRRILAGQYLNGEQEQEAG